MQRVWKIVGCFYTVLCRCVAGLLTAGIYFNNSKHCPSWGVVNGCVNKLVPKVVSRARQCAESKNDRIPALARSPNRRFLCPAVRDRQLIV
jgi:hypothetical protein